MAACVSAKERGGVSLRVRNARSSIITWVLITMMWAPAAAGRALGHLGQDVDRLEATAAGIHVAREEVANQGVHRGVLVQGELAATAQRTLIEVDASPPQPSKRRRLRKAKGIQPEAPAASAG